MPAPHAILFDIGGTVLDERRYDLEAGVRSLVGEDSVAVAEICRTFRAERDDCHRVNRELDLPKWLTKHLSLHHDTVTLEDELWSVIVTLVPVPGVEMVLRRLKSDHIPIAAISNAPFSARILEAEIEKHGLGGYFQFVLSSADVGFRKPAAVIFETALPRLGVTAGQTWFIGDTFREDIVGATGAGLRPIFISRDPVEPGADYTGLQIRNWNEFMPIYEAACADKDAG
jgi:HAD superfamily hydrolase (TIGR01549 family)